MQEYQDKLNIDPARRAIIEALDLSTLLNLYIGLVRNRLHDITLKRWVKLGVISKAWLGTGEEAVTIGSAHALNRHREPIDFVAPMIRNAGACHEMGMPLADMFRGYLATDDSPTNGRDLHIGSMAKGIIAPISHVGDMVAVCNGIALHFKMARSSRLVLTWIGDGSTKTGVFHEAINFAAVQRLPLIVIIQNNQVALGTKLSQYNLGDFATWPQAYGIEGTIFDGNNVLDTYATMHIAVERVRNGGGPALLIAETFRMGGHATHDEEEAHKVLTPELFTYWGKRDPIGCYETYLITQDKDLAGDQLSRPPLARRENNQAILTQLEEKVTVEVEAAAAEALESKKRPLPKPEDLIKRVYATGG
jgi:pyruvate dehydrogenase E1 component alpha subunit/2-oxoisovalerate dehydrogenase E1 component alpha subunit